jgi:hypothetical protein
MYQKIRNNEISCAKWKISRRNNFKSCENIVVLVVLVVLVIVVIVIVLIVVVVVLVVVVVAVVVVRKVC